jgi:hypothetical protein
MSEETDVQEDIIDGDNPITEEQYADVEIEQSQETGEIPSKYQGKALEDIIRMHQEAEQALSRQGNELGATRDLNGKLENLLQTLNSPKPVQEEQPDWDYEPEKAAASLVSKEVGAIKQELDTFRKQNEIEKFVDQNPEFMQASGTDEFMQWVQASPYRTALYQKNHNSFDPITAKELAMAWSERPSAQVQTRDRKDDLKAATMEKGASSGGSRKRTWSRTYIRELMRNDPAKYKAHRDEIEAAYAEGRVKP